MSTLTVHITARHWAYPDDPRDRRVILTFCHPASPGRCYLTAPCVNTQTGEDAAIRAVIYARQASGLDVHGQPTEAAPEPRTIAL